MADIEPAWELYRSFLAVMREGSLSGAARALGMTQPSLGRHMRELETALGAALFARSPQGLEPTELARELVVETAVGTAELLRTHLPADVRRAVASPGGSTEAGLEALDREGGREAFEAAVRASLQRMRG